MKRFEHANGVVTLGFESLANGMPVQGHVATRHGGVSPAPWRSLNFSVARGDSRERVAENRRRLGEALDIDPARLARCQQVHGTQVAQVDANRGSRDRQPEADALITGAPDIPLALVFADCVPVLLYDARRHALGVCHAGWRGTVAGAAVATLQAMRTAYGTQAQDVVAGIGPSIGPASYEVGADVVAAARAALPDAERCLVVPASGGTRLHFDLWLANRLQLEAAGVPARQIEVSEIDTAQNTHDFFSHRGEQGRCGLFTMVAWLEAAG